MRALYIVGPTGSGKSSLASHIAKDVGGEIVNADAFQLYQDIETVTAAPSKDELNQAPHHLYGTLSLKEESNAAKYSVLAKDKIAKINASDKLAIVTGGSGLYIKSLTHGLLDLPASDPNIKKELENLPIEKLIEKIQKIDPVGAVTINLKNKRYLVRALEISILCGEPMSEVKKNWENNSPKFHGVLIERPREELYHRIDSRVITMFESGAPEEIKNLPDDISETANKAIGIKEIKEYLSGKISLEESISNIQKSSRNYAKRQITWFKREVGFQKVCLSVKDDPESEIRNLMSTINSMKNVN